MTRNSFCNAQAAVGTRCKSVARRLGGGLSHVGDRRSPRARGGWRSPRARAHASGDRGRSCAWGSQSCFCSHRRLPRDQRAQRLSPRDQRALSASLPPAAGATGRPRLEPREERSLRPPAAGAARGGNCAADARRKFYNCQSCTPYA